MKAYIRTWKRPSDDAGPVSISDSNESCLLVSEWYLLLQQSLLLMKRFLFVIASFTEFRIIRERLESLFQETYR